MYFFIYIIEVFLYHQRHLKIGLLNYNEKNIALFQQSVSQAQILAPQVNETSNKGNNPKMDAVIYFTHLAQCYSLWRSTNQTRPTPGHGPGSEAALS